MTENSQERSPQNDFAAITDMVEMADDAGLRLKAIDDQGLLTFTPRDPESDEEVPQKQLDEWCEHA